MIPAEDGGARTFDPAKASRLARIGLATLTFINLFNYLDRYVVSALVETLKKSELHLSDQQAGLLMTGFIVVYMLASPVFGVLGDRFSRTRLIAFGVAFWSLATALGGLAGLIVGELASILTNKYSPLPAFVPLWAILVGIGISAAVGIVFGLWPAWKAARLDPIEALRYE